MSKKLVALVAALGIVAVAVFAGGGYLLWSRLHDGDGSQSADGSEEVDDGSPFRYLDAQDDVERGHEFTFTVGFDPVDPDEDPTFDPDVSHVVDVYTDPALTRRADYGAEVEPAGRGKYEITVSPPVSETSAYCSDDCDEVTLARAGEWGPYPQYYLVQRVDLKSGEAFARPEVTPFTVTPDLETPSVSQQISAQGDLELSWDAVEGADEYAVVHVEDRAEDSMPGGFYRNYDTVAVTTSTAWSALDGERDTSDLGTQRQNLSLTSYKVSADEAISYGDDLPDEPLAVDFAVVALGPDGASPLAVLSDSVMANLPYSIAYEARNQMDIGGMLDRMDEIPATMPVTMSDGRTVVKPVRLDPESRETTRIIEGVENEFGTQMTGEYQALKVRYTVAGTALSGYFSVKEYTPGNEAAEITAAQEVNKTQWVKTGIETSFTYGKPAGAPVHEVAAMPDVDYPVSGSNEMVRFIAAALMDGADAINLQQYPMAASADLVYDAVAEACYQNPYLLLASCDIAGWYETTDRVLSIRWPVDQSADDRRRALADKVTAVVASVVTDGMDDTAKARALDDYLTQNVQYDFNSLEALETNDIATMETIRASRTADGALLDGSVVCSGYAFAFQALAQAAGLDSIVVVGDTPGGYHAWNKVRVDGAWRMIDPTWNDNDWGQEWFLMTDAQAAPDHTETADAMMDSVVADYAAS